MMAQQVKEVPFGGRFGPVWPGSPRYARIHGITTIQVTVIPCFKITPSQARRGQVGPVARVFFLCSFWASARAW